VGLYFLLSPYLGLETLSWVCVLGAAPFAAIGFITYHSMTAEQFVWAWLKSELLTPKRLVYTAQNLYLDAVDNPVKDGRKTNRKGAREVVGPHVKDD
jgi:hypothetical protein